MPRMEEKPVKDFILSSQFIDQEEKKLQQLQMILVLFGRNRYPFIIMMVKLKKKLT